MSRGLAIGMDEGMKNVRLLWKAVWWILACVHGMQALPFGASMYLPMESVRTGELGERSLVGGTHRGTLNGTGIQLVPGKLGQALHTGATNGHINLGNTRDTCFGELERCPGGVAMALWIKMETMGDSEAYYVCNGGQTSSSYGISVHGKTSGNVLQLNVKSKTNWYRYNQEGLQLKTWYHVAFSWTPSGNLLAYVDGKYVGKSDILSRAISTSSYNDFYIGRPNNNDFYYGNAYLDEILFWDSAQPPEFFAYLYQFYGNKYELDFVPRASFRELGGARLVNVSPIDACVPRPWKSHEPHPCRLHCMWMPWCGAVVYNGHRCLYYNIHQDYEIIVESDPKCHMFVKEF